MVDTHSSLLRIVGANLHRKAVRIQHMETEVASLLVDGNGSARLEIRGDGVLIEVIGSDREMVHFARRVTRSQDQKILPKHELVVSVPFVHTTTENALVEIRRSLQIADEKRDMIDAVALKSRGV